jgi:ubiquitin-conjugating enzyme E2 N
LSSPNPDDPLNNDAAAHWKSNESAALQQAIDYTKKYANK